MPKRNLDIIEDLPSIGIIKRRFSFISNSLLVHNLSLALQYIVFLVALQNRYLLKKAPASYIVKDIIIHSSSIVEATLAYTLERIIDINHELEKKICREEKIYRDVHCHYKTEEFDLITAKVIRKKLPLNEDTNFNTLNFLAKRIDLFPESLYIKSENLRTLRNKVHLTGLKNIENHYQASQTDHIFGDVKILLDRCEEFLAIPHITF